MISYVEAALGVVGLLGAFLGYVVTIERRLSRIEGYCKARACYKGGGGGEWSNS